MYNKPLLGTNPSIFGLVHFRVLEAILEVHYQVWQHWVSNDTRTTSGQSNHSWYDTARRKNENCLSIIWWGDMNRC